MYTSIANDAQIKLFIAFLVKSFFTILLIEDMSESIFRFSKVDLTVFISSLSSDSFILSKYSLSLTFVSSVIVQLFSSLFTSFILIFSSLFRVTALPPLKSTPRFSPLVKVTIKPITIIITTNAILYLAHLSIFLVLIFLHYPINIFILLSNLPVFIQ